MPALMSDWEQISLAISSSDIRNQILTAFKP